MSGVLITRPRADAEPLAAALAARGIAALVEPMLEIVPLPGPPVTRGEAQALLFTSVNGVRALLERNGGVLGELSALPAYAVGDATAGAARRAGFVRVESAAGDVAALADLVVARCAPAAGALLHIAGSAVAGDLSARLSAAGFVVHRQAIYEARKARALSPATADALRRGAIDAVTFFSPRTATAFVTLCRHGSLAPSLSRIAAACLSETVAAAARAVAWRAVLVAARPDQAALLDCLAAAGVHGANADATAGASGKTSPMRQA